MNMIKFILTDIEGTTSDISFVKDTLFPYAAEHLPLYIRQFKDLPHVSTQLSLVAEESHCSTSDLDQIIDVLLSWIQQDIKNTALKELQGLVWAYGYEQEHFKGHLYLDAFEELKLWQEKGLSLGVYSSGSVQAQKLLFAHSIYGDLQSLFSQHYDTKVGHKRELKSYQAIVDDLSEKGLVTEASEVLFLSDVLAELDAAKSVGLCTVEVRRDQQEGSHAHPTVNSFAQIKNFFPQLDQ